MTLAEPTGTKTIAKATGGTGPRLDSGSAKNKVNMYTRQVLDFGGQDRL